MKYYTLEGLDVTERINKGKTAYFTEQADAEAHAKQKSSYVYDIRLKDKRGKIVEQGYGVPK